MVINGYKLKTTDIAEIMTEMEKIKRQLKKITDREYHKLLSEEITYLVDRISLNDIQRDNNITIFDGAIQNVAERIARAEAINTESKYNFRVFAHIMPEGDSSYIKVICPNSELLKAFKGLNDYSLSEIECEDPKNAKTILWNKLHKQYSQTEPMVISLTQQAEPDKEKLHFQSVQERAEKEARNIIIMRLLSEISGGKEIPPIRLMNYFDEALEQYVNSKSLEIERKEKVAKLMSILIDLEKDSSIVYLLPGQEKLNE